MARWRAVNAPHLVARRHITVGGLLMEIRLVDDRMNRLR